MELAVGIRDLPLAEQTVAEAQRRYLKGLTDYLSVLTSQASQQQTERQIVAGKAGLLANRITLCRALGGSWMNELEEPAPQATNPGDRRPRR